MTTITVLPHPEIAPKGASIEGKKGNSLCEALLYAGLRLSTRAARWGRDHLSLNHQRRLFFFGTGDDLEEDMLDKAWGLSPFSRLSCQAIIGDTPLTVEIPKYSINHAREES